MTSPNDIGLQYPIGPFDYVPENDLANREKYIDSIAVLPGKLRKLVEGLSKEQLGLGYREGSWSVSQIVHHMADSHMNAYIRFKLALTEHKPTIKPYEQDDWLNTPEVSSTPIEASLKILDGLHTRWSGLLKAMSAKSFARTVFHPEHKKEINLAEFLAHYAWHGEHHLAHIDQALS